MILVSEGLMTKLLALLAHRHCSIFYLSTATQDYILVKSDELSGVLQCLSENLTLGVNLMPSSGQQLHVNATSNYTEVSLPNTAPSKGVEIQIEIVHELKIAYDLHVRLTCLSDEFYLHSISIHEIGRIMKPLIDILFLKGGTQKFVSFAIVQEEVCILYNFE